MVIVNGKSLKQNHNYFLECAKIHSKEIPNGFLPRLGLSFLSSLYEFFSKSKYSFLLIAVENSKVIGFIAISLHTKLFFKQYLWTQSYKNLHKISLLIFGKVFILNIIELFKYLFKNNKEKKNFVSDSEIFNFCVDSSVQRQGVGQLLFSQAVNNLDSNNVKILKIVTGQNQINAQKFYSKFGAIFSHEIILHKGQKSKVFKYKISKV